MHRIERTKFYAGTAIASLILYIASVISAVYVENQWLFLSLVLCGAMLALIGNNVAEGWEAFGVVKDDPAPDWEELEKMIRERMEK